MLKILTLALVVLFALTASPATKAEDSVLDLFFTGEAFEEKTEPFEGCIAAFVVYTGFAFEPESDGDYQAMADQMPEISGGSAEYVRLMHARASFVVWAHEVTPLDAADRDETLAWVADCYATLISLDEME